MIESKRGAYRALASRRVYIPKPDGRQRPLAVAALEDKIVQRAVAALLSAASGAGSASRRPSTSWASLSSAARVERGKFQIKRKTRADRMRAKLKMVQQEMRRRMHQPIAAQGKWLWYVVNGYFNYHAVPTNFRALVTFRTEIARRWRRILTRRSDRTKLNWEQMNRLLDAWIPKPRILHPWPDKRFAVRYPR
jgi:hypothetical protein